MGATYCTEETYKLTGRFKLKISLVTYKNDPRQYYENSTNCFISSTQEFLIIDLHCNGLLRDQLSSVYSIIYQ